MDLLPASAVVTQVDDGYKFKLVGAVSGDITPIQQEIERVVSARPKRVYLDLGSCEFISSAGMGAIVSFHSRIRASGGSLNVVAIRKMVFGSFRIGRLDQLLGIAPEAIISR